MPVMGRFDEKEKDMDNLNGRSIKRGFSRVVGASLVTVGSVIHLQGQQAASELAMSSVIAAESPSSPVAGYATGIMLTAGLILIMAHPGDVNREAKAFAARTNQACQWLNRQMNRLFSDRERA